MIESGRINIKNSCKGYYLRWWYNGWHYWFFLPGTIAFNTEGEKYVTLGTQSIRVGSGQVDYGQISALRTILNSKEVYIYTDSGWANARIEQESVIVYDNKVSGYEMEFTLFTGSKSISVNGYTPIADIPLVPYIPYIGYGALYNWYAIDTGLLAPIGWHIPTEAEFITFLGTINPNGFHKLREIGTLHWLPPNLGATDIYGFTAFGGGYRLGFDGSFSDLTMSTSFTHSDLNGFGFNGALYLDEVQIFLGNVQPNDGYSIRCFLDGINPPNPGTVTDIDGNIYPTIKIGTQVMMAENLKVTHYNDGTPIPIITDDGTWAADTTGAMCWYNNTP